MEKNTFFVIEQQNILTGKVYAYARKVPNCYNLRGLFVPSKGYEIVSINACDSWKKAQATADNWNECAKNNGNYALV